VFPQIQTRNEKSFTAKDAKDAKENSVQKAGRR
jgi:hypothetical protein